jgi:hypothetical protein
MADDHPVERAEARERRLRSVIEQARISGRRLDGERLLFAVGAVLVPVGVLMIVVAWHGVANTGAVFEQIPFVVSGGIGGLALVVLGGFLYFAWWQTRALREAREHAARSLEVAEATLVALRELQDAQRELAERLAPTPRARASRASRVRDAS